jgi:hypothetical protein
LRDDLLTVDVVDVVDGRDLRFGEGLGAVTTPSAYNLSMAPSTKPSICATMSVVSSPIDGASCQISPGVNDIFGTTP